jgi:two-component system, OmpR family, KDP operon response regulator KdpE
MKTVFIGANPKIAEMATLGVGLRWPDATVLGATTAAEGLGVVVQESPDLVIVHSSFSDMALSQVIPELRAFSNVPLLALGPRVKETEVVIYLDLGADDYVPLPCSSPVLMMRIYALLRLSGMPMPSSEIESPLLSGELFVIPAACQVFLDNQQVPLTATEFRLLYLLIKNRGSVVDHHTLELSLELGQATDGSGPVKKYVSSLRRKLGDNAQEPRWIATAQGSGYLFIGPDPISETPRGVATN